MKILSCAWTAALRCAYRVCRNRLGSRGKRPVAAHAFRHALLGKLAELDVSQAQKQQIHAVLRESRPTIKPLVTQYVQERRTLRKTIHTAPVNEAAIRAQAARVAQIGANLDVKRAYISERIRAVLAPQ